MHCFYLLYYINRFEGLAALDREVRYLENLVGYKLEKLIPFISRPLAERLLNALEKIARRLRKLAER